MIFSFGICQSAPLLDFLMLTVLLTPQCSFFADPPGPPRISGLRPGSRLRAGGRPRRLTCSAVPAGRPPARLEWYLGDQMVESRYSVEDGRARAQITFVPKVITRDKTRVRAKFGRLCPH